MDRWLIIDGNYLAYRAFYSTPSHLSWNDKPTATLYGFFRDLFILLDDFKPSRVSLCFDHGRSKRYDLCPSYKSARRKNLAEDEIISIDAMKVQVEILKTELLRQIGFSNVHYQFGYEADDVIASLAHFSVPHGVEGLIISGDQDLYQLLRPGIKIYNPITKVVTTDRSFRFLYGIEPNQWIWVKAIAGCRSDSVPGVKGVGEKTALKYLRDELGGAKLRSIEDSVELWRDNVPLIRLPMAGTWRFAFLEDSVNLNQDWDSVMKSLGIKSLEGKRGKGRS